MISATSRPKLRLIASEPRAPELALAFGRVAHALARRLLELDDASLGVLECAAGASVFVVRGPSAQLPWVDGVRYLAALGGAPELFVPTQQVPNVHPSLAARALRRLHAGPIAWVVDDDGRDTIMRLDELRAPSRARLHAYCESAL